MSTRFDAYFCFVNSYLGLITVNCLQCEEHQFRKYENASYVKYVNYVNHYY